MRKTACLLSAHGLHPWLSDYHFFIYSPTSPLSYLLHPTEGSSRTPKLRIAPSGLGFFPLLHTPTVHAVCCEAAGSASKPSHLGAGKSISPVESSSAMMQLAALLEAAIRQCESHARCSCDVHVGVMRGEPQTIHATEFLVTAQQAMGKAMLRPSGNAALNFYFPGYAPRAPMMFLRLLISESQPHRGHI
ncbi:Uncharacterized UPF0442 protein C7D4.12c [Fusarium oxysporum f. sp. albedinis]|nr:Uncharacterized UPF0442 protein C7D4.12c [Fusarium oxysporum f. sp. albedinis]